MAALAACSQPTPPAAKTERAGACGAGVEKLAGVGLCPADAEKLLVQTDGETPELPAGCTWILQDTRTEAGDEALLYRAASCKGVVTKLTANRGAKSITYGYATSAVFGDNAKDQTPITQFLSLTGDVNAEIKAQALLVAEPSDNIANCEVRVAGTPGWPKDAVVLDLTAAAKRRAKVNDADGVRQACGMYGIDTGATTYWLAKQGDAWFFQLGQESPDFDPRSVTFLRKSEAGAWEVAKAE